MYTRIKGHITAEEAAAELVHHAKLIETSILSGNNLSFPIRKAGVNALMELLEQYTQQEVTLKEQAAAPLSDADLKQHCRTLALMGRQIDAIKMYREHRKCDLKKAHNAILELMVS